MEKTNKITITLDPTKVEFDKCYQETLIEQSQHGLDVLGEVTEKWVGAIKLNISEMEQGNYLLANTRMAQIANSMRRQAEYWEHLRKCFAVDAQKQTLKAIIDSNQK